MRRTTTVLILAACLALVGCSASEQRVGDREACKEELSKRVEAGASAPTSAVPACMFLDKGELEAITEEVVGEVIDEAWKDAFSGWPTPTP